jgi:outer membrane biosynthesis protein TonB
MESDLRPALIVSVALHLSLLAAAVIVWPNVAKPIPTASVTVKLVAQAPVTDVRPALEAPEPPPAAAPEPAPQAPPPEAAPTPPTPVPPKPEPTPPAPAPTPPPLDLDALASKMPKRKLDLNALASKLPQTKAPPRLDLNALASKLPQTKAPPRLDLNALASKAPKAANAPPGPLRPEQAAQSRTAAGAAQGLTADEASLLASKLNRLWNPNCGAEGASEIQVRVNIQLTPTGALAAPPSLIGGQVNSPLWQAAAQRALNAVARGAPYDELPRERYTVWKDINFNFNGRQACGGL